MSILVDQMTAENTGTSQAALDAARAIFSLDGLAPFRKSLDDEYDRCAAVADWARAVDRSNSLIAAATDLLEALSECITENGAFAFASDDYYRAKQRLMAISNIARAAIAKATK